MEAVHPSIEAVVQETAPAKAKGKPGRPKAVAKSADATNLAAMPEVQALIASAVEKASAAILDQLSAARAVSGAPAMEGDRTWARELSASIVQAANPGKRQIDPALLEQREQARERMHGLLIEARAKGHVPVYKVTSPVYFDQQLVQATYTGSDRVVRNNVIGWPHTPNENIEPAEWTLELERQVGCSKNPADEIYRAFLESIGGVTTEGVRPKEDRPQSGTLRVLTGGELRSVPQVGNQGRNQADRDLSFLGRNQPGEIKQTNVLGTVHPAARQAG